MRMTDAPAAPIRTNTLALVGFIAAFMIPVAGFVLGILATRQIEQTHESGRGLARAATIIGLVATVVQVLFFIVWLILFVQAFLHFPPTTS